MTLRTPDLMKDFPALVISLEWRGWREESNEVHGEIQIGRTQLTRDVDPLLVLEGPGDKGWQIRISGLPTETPESSIREPGRSAAGATLVGDDRALRNGLDETKAEEHRCRPRPDVHVRVGRDRGEVRPRRLLAEDRSAKPRQFVAGL